MGRGSPLNGLWSSGLRTAAGSAVTLGVSACRRSFPAGDPSISSARFEVQCLDLRTSRLNKRGFIRVGRSDVEDIYEVPGESHWHGYTFLSACFILESRTRMVSEKWKE